MLSKMNLDYLHLIWILMWLIFSLTPCYFFPIYPICFLFLFISFFFVSFGITCFSMITLNLLWFFIAYFILVAALKIMAYILAYLNCHNVHSSDNYTTLHTVYEFCHSVLQFSHLVFCHNIAVHFHRILESVLIFYLKESYHF